jgi:hypothetical protein
MYSSFLRISSAERINKNDSTSDFTVSINNDSKMQKVTMIAVKEVTIPNTAYNITSNNNAFYMSNLAGDIIYTFRITPGQYTITTIIQHINTNPANIYFTLSQDPYTLKLKATRIFATPLQFITGNQNINNILGIVAPLVFYINTEFQSLPDLSGIRNFYVISNTLGDGNAMISPTLPKMSIISVVPNNTEWGHITYYNSNEQKLDEIYYPSQTNGKNISFIDLKLISIDGQLINLNGLDWSILLKVYYN